MSSAIRKLAGIPILLVRCRLLAATPELRVCADPNNLPYSNQQQQGFENALAKLAASDLGMNVSYFWFPATPQVFPQHFAGGGLRRGDGGPIRNRRSEYDNSVLSFHVCVCVAPRSRSSHSVFR